MTTLVAGMSSPAERTAATRQRPYFIWWDQDATEDDVREALVSDNLYTRIMELADKLVAGQESEE